MGCLFSTSQVTRVFGPYTTFAVNPWHPRHIISIVSFALALPSVAVVAVTVYRGMSWAVESKRQINPYLNN